MTFTLEPASLRTVTEPVTEPAVQPLSESELLTWPVTQPVEPAERPVEPAAKPARIRTVLTPRVARRVALVSFLAYWAPVVIMPPPDGTNPVMPWWAATLDYSALVLLAGSWLLLAAGRRSGLVASVGGSLAVLALTAECPISDHHEIAPWWWMQLAASVGVLALSVALLRRTKKA
jgi:hypothetical protein